ncbi:MAG: DNA-3-methyladenine glycosylase 2 family protein [Polyangiaceae bacterium]|nr:DNA-3-methyladenine glycosylase 2 family protein [Polyangiaceae bacterium]
MARATRALRRRDPALRAWIRALGPCTLAPGRQPDHLTALVRSIVYQQLSGRAASTIFARLVALLPARAGVATPRLRAAGLSHSKITYLRDLCARIDDGRLVLERISEQSDAEAESALTQVRGLGRWSAHMFLLFHLGRPDVWPLDDLGVRKALMRLDGLLDVPTPRDVERRGDVWRPYRSVASWYLWRALDAGAALDVGW